jgi:septum formation topological specificity factor MinE
MLTNEQLGMQIDMFVRSIDADGTHLRAEALTKDFSDVFWDDLKSFSQVIRVPDSTLTLLQHRFEQGDQVTTPRYAVALNTPRYAIALSHDKRAEQLSQAVKAMRQDLLHYVRDWVEKNPLKVMFVAGPQVFCRVEHGEVSFFAWFDRTELSLQS